MEEIAGEAGDHRSINGLLDAECVCCSDIQRKVKDDTRSVQEEYHGGPKENQRRAKKEREGPKSDAT